MANKNTTKDIKTICLDHEVTEQMEKLRQGKAHFYSGFVNTVLRERFGLPERE